MTERKPGASSHTTDTVAWCVVGQHSGEEIELDLFHAEEEAIHYAHRNGGVVKPLAYARSERVDTPVGTDSYTAVVNGQSIEVVAADDYRALERENADLRRLIEKGRSSTSTELSLSAQLEEQRAGNIKLLERAEAAEAALVPSATGATDIDYKQRWENVTAQLPTTQCPKGRWKFALHYNGYWYVKKSHAESLLREAEVGEGGPCACIGEGNCAYTNGSPNCERAAAAPLVRVEAVDTQDALIGATFMQYIDRLQDPVSTDPLETIVAELLKAVHGLPVASPRDSHT